MNNSEKTVSEITDTTSTAAANNADAVKNFNLLELIENYKNIDTYNKEVSDYNCDLIFDYCEKKDLDYDNAEDFAFAQKKVFEQFKLKKNADFALDELIKTFVTTLNLPFIIINSKMNIDGSFDYSYLLNEKAEKEQKSRTKKESLYFTSKDNLIDYLTEQNEFTANVICVYNDTQKQVTINIRNYFEKLQETFKSLGKSDFTGFNIYRATKKLA